METIISKDNALIKEIQKLLKSAKHRAEAAAFVIEGFRLCSDALESGVKIKTLCISQSALDKEPVFAKRIELLAEKAYILKDSLFKALSDTVGPQGILCVCHKSERSFSVVDGKFIGLENIQDPQNLGTVLRTAEALGISGVIMSGGCCDIYSPKVLRGSMGAVFRIPFFVTDDLPEFTKTLKRDGFQTFGAVVDKSARDVTSISFHSVKKAIVLIGNEGNGLTDAMLNVCDKKITIPMDGRAESLNASAAASIIMWEMVRAHQ